MAALLMVSTEEERQVTELQAREGAQSVEHLLSSMGT